MENYNFLPPLTPNECDPTKPSNNCAPTWDTSFNYIALSDLANLYGFQIDADTTELLPRAIAYACQRINSITGNKINSTGFDNLNVTQRDLVKRASCMLAMYYLKDGSDFIRSSVSYSGNGMSVSQSPPSEPDYVPEEVYNLLQQAGLYRPRTGLNVQPLSQTYGYAENFNDGSHNLVSSGELGQFSPTWDQVNGTFIRGALSDPDNFKGIQPDPAVVNNPLKVRWGTSGQVNPVAFLSLQGGGGSITPANSGIASEVDTDGKINVLSDNSSIKVGTDNKLKLGYDLGNGIDLVAGSPNSKIAVKIDNSSLGFNEQGQLESALVFHEPIVKSGNDVNLQIDTNKGLGVTGDNLNVKVDVNTIGFDTSGNLKWTVGMGQGIELVNAPTPALQPIVDGSTITFSPTGQLMALRDYTKITLIKSSALATSDFTFELAQWDSNNEELIVSIANYNVSSGADGRGSCINVIAPNFDYNARPSNHIVSTGSNSGTNPTINTIRIRKDTTWHIELFQRTGPSSSNTSVIPFTGISVYRRKLLF